MTSAPDLPIAVDDTLGSLISHIQPLSPDSPVSAAYGAFTADPTLYAIAVVDADRRPVGLLNRFKFLEAFSRPFAHDLFKHQTVAAAMDTAPLIVDEQLPLDQLSTALVAEATRYIFDGFVVTRHGRYLGIGTGYSLMRCLTERKHATLFHLAHHDSLTGLPNRQLFNDRLTQLLAHAARSGERLGVLYLDVDRLKTVNDSFGHAVGDFLLKSVADRLTAITRTEDTVARLSGDEFAVILTNLADAADGDVVARKLLGRCAIRTYSKVTPSRCRAASASPSIRWTRRRSMPWYGPPTRLPITRSSSGTPISATRRTSNIRRQAPFRRSHR